MAEQVIETGDLYFFARPKGQAGSIRGLDDIEDFYMVMSPVEPDLFRLVEVGQKKMPEIPLEPPAQAEKSWAIINYVTESSNDMENNKLHGEVTAKGLKKPTLPAGVARYLLVLNKNQTELAYSLEVPTRLGPVQRMFNILSEAAYTMKVKNPEYHEEGYPGVEQEPTYPSNLTGLFDENIVNVKDNHLLDFQDTQLLLIGAQRQNVEQDLSIGFMKESAKKAVDRIYGTFHMREEEHPLEPLVEGQWPGMEEAA